MFLCRKKEWKIRKQTLLLLLDVICGVYYRKGVELGLITICLRGWATSLPPACFTNSAGERKLPWHTHIIRTSCPLPYLYSIPSILFPLGPSPLVKTHGISSMAFVPISLAWSLVLLGLLDGLSISAPDILLARSIVLTPDEPTSLLPVSCVDWKLAGLSSPEPVKRNWFHWQKNHWRKQCKIWSVHWSKKNCLWFFLGQSLSYG